MKIAPDASLPVFVYGTLKRGNRNAGRLASSGFVGEAVTPARFSLYCLGYAPGMVLGGETAVTGECYVVTPAVLEALDGFEGHPWKYRRVRITVTLTDGTPLSVWTYALRGYHVAAEGGKPVPSGSWVQPSDAEEIAAWRRVRRDPEAAAYLAFLTDLEAEGEVLLYGYCPDCGTPLDPDYGCESCPTGTRAAIERWARETA